MVQKKYKHFDIGFGVTENTAFNFKFCFSLKTPMTKSRFTARWQHCSNTGQASRNYSFDLFMLSYTVGK